MELKLEAAVEIEPQSVRLCFTCWPHHLRPDPIKQRAGTSSVFDMNDWTFINADLTVSIGREPLGEWVLLDAETWIGPDSVKPCRASSSKSGDQPLFQLVPFGPSSRITPLAFRSSRMRSDSLKSLAFRAA